MELRYEEYPDTEGALGFVLYEGITRSPLCRSEKQNWHEGLEFELCTEGEGTVLIGGVRHPLRAGEFAIVDSDAIHYTESDSSLTYSCLVVGGELCRRMGIDPRALAFRPIVKSESMKAAFLRLCEAYREEGTLRTARLYAILLPFLIDAVEHHAAPKGFGGEEKELAAVKRATVFLREHYREKLTLDEIARHAGTDKYTLCKIFRRVTGETVFSFLGAHRCHRAAEHLCEGRSVGEAAFLSGFDSPSFFTKAFRKYMGCLPSSYRKR